MKKGPEVGDVARHAQNGDSESLVVDVRSDRGEVQVRLARGAKPTVSMWVTAKGWTFEPSPLYEAIAKHAERYPNGDAYSCEVAESEKRSGTWVVTLRCDHFSVPQRYLINQHE